MRRGALALAVALAAGGFSDDPAGGKRGPKRTLPVPAAKDADGEGEDDGGPAAGDGDDGETRRRVAPDAGGVSCGGGTEPRGSGPPNGTESFCIKVTDGAGVKHGPYRVWYPDGTLQMEGRYDDGAKSGQWTMYNEDGTLHGESTWVDDRQDGPWTTWHDNGKKAGQGTYEAGKKVGRGTFWWPNGNKKAEGSYVDDLREGASVNWYENGKLESQGEYKAGKKEGPWMEFSADGQVTQKTYADGVAVAG